jgi:hypothetical protein
MIWALAISASAILLLTGKVYQMSASLDRLKAAVVSVAAKVTTLETQPTGTPDAELDVISAQLEAIAAPTIPAPPPAAE